MPDRSGQPHLYAVISPSLDGYGLIEAAEIAAMTERHHFEMKEVAFRVGDVTKGLGAPAAPEGAIVMLEQGLPGRRHLRLLSRLQKRGLRTFLTWPHEHTIEVVDSERLGSLRRHWIASLAAHRLRRWLSSHATALSTSTMAGVVPTGLPALDPAGIAAVSDLVRGEVASLHRHVEGGVAALRAIGTPQATSLADQFATSFAALDRMQDQATRIGVALVALQATAASQQVAPAVDSAETYTDAHLPAVRTFVRSTAEAAAPQPFPRGTVPQPSDPLAGTGVYLRLDFWAPLTSGGSYGHTCYQAQALAKTTSDFVCVQANRYELLDTLGVRQVVVPARSRTQTVANLLGMNAHYCERVGPIVEALRPAYVFERIVLGSAVGAWACGKLGIPYIAEYNGSEISISRSFAGRGYEHEDLLLAAEDAAFRQATLISVVSDHVADDVERRGIPRSRILVNPNAVDLEAYAPADEGTFHKLRLALGFEPQHRVVGFIGTFGGWHGIEILAEAMPRIAAGDDNVRFLLIGDGYRKPIVREAIARTGIENRVVDVGRVPQAKGAELLKTCDILVSPHASHMIDSPFFGSPTKLFEYMAMGAGIVASDLEQIGQVLSPALTLADFAAARALGRSVKVPDQRAVLCRPGDAAEFAAAVLALVADRDACRALGRNARLAAARYYAWDQHVRNLWLALNNLPTEGYSVDRSKG